jgi:hypothetical protein
VQPDLPDARLLGHARRRRSLQDCSQDITGAVLALAGGSITVCGECISNTATGESRNPNDAASAIEALCVKVRGSRSGSSLAS